MLSTTVQTSPLTFTSFSSKFIDIQEEPIVKSVRFATILPDDFLFLFLSQKHTICKQGCMGRECQCRAKKKKVMNYDRSHRLRLFIAEHHVVHTLGATVSDED